MEGGGVKVGCSGVKKVVKCKQFLTFLEARRFTLSLWMKS